MRRFGKVLTIRWIPLFPCNRLDTGVFRLPTSNWNPAALIGWFSARSGSRSTPLCKRMQGGGIHLRVPRASLRYDSGRLWRRLTPLAIGVLTSGGTSIRVVGDQLYKYRYLGQVRLRTSFLTVLSLRRQEVRHIIWKMQPSKIYIISSVVKFQQWSFRIHDGRPTTVHPPFQPWSSPCFTRGLHEKHASTRCYSVKK